MTKPPFDAQIEFIQETGIPIALVGLLTALKDTNLWERLKREGRLLDRPIEINATSLNFKPQMDPATLVEGYLRVIGTIYDSTLENYFERCLTLLKHLSPVPHINKPVSEHALYTGIMGVRRRLTRDQLPAFSRYVTKVSKDHPRMMPLAIRLAATGHHCEKFTRQQTVIREFKEYLNSQLATVHDARAESTPAPEAQDRLRRAALNRANARRKAIPEEFRYAGDGISEALAAFRLALDPEVPPARVNGGNLPVAGQPPGPRRRGTCLNRALCARRSPRSPEPCRRNAGTMSIRCGASSTRRRVARGRAPRSPPRTLARSC